MRKNNPKKAIFHCTATKEGRRVSLAECTSWHLARNFKDIGYHYLVHLDGEVSRGRKESTPGAHCKGLNFESVGIAYVGGLDSEGRPKDTRTPEQKHALRMLAEYLQNKYEGLTLHGHNEFANKACPCFKIDEL